MNSFSVIIPVHNNAGVIRRTLLSVEEAIAFLHRTEPRYREAAAEIVVHDDGSTDTTLDVVREVARGRDWYQIVQSPQKGGISHARNRAVEKSRGQLLFFLDGDDLYFPGHLAACLKLLADRPDLDFVKTRVALADPVLPEWKKRIENSLVINLCVRRPCHDFIEGFPELHLYRRGNHQLQHLLDAIGPAEDVFYNTMLGGLFRGGQLAEETVQYLRYPGNAYDRQYPRFQAPPAEVARFTTPEEIWYDQLRLLMIQRHLRYLRCKQQTAAAKW